MTQYQLNTLHLQGFDESTKDSVRCSQCKALMINGVAAHEHGCPNQMHECRGCDAIVERRVYYCKDCRRDQGKE